MTQYDLKDGPTTEYNFMFHSVILHLLKVNRFDRFFY